MDSEYRINGPLIDIVDQKWKTDTLPDEDIAVPIIELPDPEPDGGNSQETLKEQEQKWTDLALNLVQQTHMEFPDLGQSCREASCRQLDFLPIQCSYCQNIYCKNHSFPEKHNCEHVPVTELDLSLKPSTACSLPNCKGKEVEPFDCKKCGAQFCVSHRHAADHNCPSLVSPEQTKVLLAPTFPSVLPGSKGGRKNAQLSTQVKLMKLKQSAKGVKELPAEERIYFALSFQNAQHSVFVSQHWSIGKAIDCIAALVQARNTNNAGGPKLELVRPDSEVISATKEKLISELIRSKVIANGESLVLEYR